ncbi:Polyadenylate-binding protein 2, partial [Stegodyphus mimosarum]
MLEISDENIETEDPFLLTGDNEQNEKFDAKETENEDPDVAMIKARVKEMEEESENIDRLQREVAKLHTRCIPYNENESRASESEREAAAESAGFMSANYEDRVEIDSRSIYVGNVDYGATAEELEHHFHGCGSINRVTIQCDKYTGHSKGFAYIEFADKESVITSAAFDESVFRGRFLKVLPKRTNYAGISTTNR